VEDEMAENMPLTSTYLFLLLAPYYREWPCLDLSGSD